MDKLIDFVCRRELRDKDLFEGERMQTIYLGTKAFEKEFSQLMNLKRIKMENEKFAKRNKMKKKFQEEDLIQDEVDLLPDKQQIFLRQFPKLS